MVILTDEEAKVLLGCAREALGKPVYEWPQIAAVASAAESVGKKMDAPLTARGLLQLAEALVLHIGNRIEVSRGGICRDRLIAAGRAASDAAELVEMAVKAEEAGR